MYDIIIIGAGAAGMSCAIYAARSGMKTMIIEKMTAGGQINLTYGVENYLGISDNPSGVELVKRMKEHVEKFEVEYKSETVKEILKPFGEIKTVKTRQNEYTAKTIVFATGAVSKKLGVEGEDKFFGQGVSYCATCDGAFFKGQDTLVVGGGNTAFEDALYLARFSRSVTLVHRRNAFRANASLIKKVRENEKIKIITDSIIKKIGGDTSVSDVIIENVNNGEISKLQVNGVFIAVGVDANTELAAKYVKTDENGFIITDRYMQTNVKGIFACGDCRDTPLRQIITAASDGAVAATSAVSYINN